MRQTPCKLSERSIRDAVISRLLTEDSTPGLLIEELCVGSARVDVARCGERLAGFEIKSDFDTLDRLARQMHAYHAVFDELTIVTTESYLSQVEALLPAWWGIWLAEGTGLDAPALVERRASAPHDRRKATHLAAMLWREEAVDFVTEALGVAPSRRATRGELHQLIAAEISIDCIRARVLRRLRTRSSLKLRSYSVGLDLPQRVDDMVAGGIAAPRRAVA